ncbi:MAG: glycosyltransferase [Propionibacteriaceae bacterium]
MTPLVSVVVPVYNTMPYLRACLDSVLAQTLGIDEIEIVAVDDGSTDTSAAELDRYAASYPDTVRVVHQPNSGGPAQPCNRGLELAVGRYVFFLGADDYLGPEALERLVRNAEDWSSDVIFGRMVGENGRSVDQRMFTSTRRDVDFLGAPLAYTLSNTKLFRRSLIDELGLHYSLDLRIGSDQPFAVAALLGARRVSVVAGYPCYHAVRRDDASNISYATDWRTKASDIAAIIDHLAELTPAGPTRDALLSRHFHWEIDLLLRNNFVGLLPADRADLGARVAALADSYLTPGVEARLTAAGRIRVRLAQLGALDTLAEVIDVAREHPVRAMTLTGERVLDWFPALDPVTGTCPPGWSTSWSELVTEDVGARLRSRTQVTEVRVEGSRLVLAGTVGLRPASAPYLRVVITALGDREPGPPDRWWPTATVPAALVTSGVSLVAGPDSASSTMHAELDLRPLVAASRSGVRRWSIRLRSEVADRVHDQPLRCVGLTLSTTFGLRHRLRYDRHHVGVLADPTGQLVLRCAAATTS